MQVILEWFSIPITEQERFVNKFLQYVFSFLCLHIPKNTEYLKCILKQIIGQVANTFADNLIQNLKYANESNFYATKENQWNP